MCEPLISSVNVDAVFIDDAYQDEGQSLVLRKDEIEIYQCYIKIFCKDGRHIKIAFQSALDICDFIRSYKLK